MTTFRNLATWAGISAALAATPAPTASAQTALRWKFENGQTLKYEFVQKNEIQVKADGQEFKSKNDLTVNLTWKVKSVATDGTADINLVIDRVRAVIEAGPQKINYDSQAKDQAEGPTKPFHDVYSVAAGADYAMKIDPRGKVVAAKVPAKVTTALQASPFVAVADGGSFLSDKGLENVFAQVIPVLPEKSVSKGDTWTGSIELPVQPLKLTLTHNDKLTELGADKAVIESSIVTAIKPDPASPLAIEVKKQEGKGTVTLDTKAGHITSSSIVQKIDLGVTAQNRQIQQTVSIDARLKLMP